MQVRNICTSSLILNVRAIYSFIQHTVLPRMGNTDVMTEIDHMVMFCLMIRRKINLVRLILDYMLSAMDDARRSHAALLYGMLLTRIFQRAQLPIDGHRKDEKYPATTMKTFSAIGLKSQGLEKVEKKKKKKEKEKEKKRKSTNLQKDVSKPSEERRSKKKHERDLSPILAERRISKRRMLRIAESSSSSAEAPLQHSP